MGASFPSQPPRQRNHPEKGVFVSPAGIVDQNRLNFPLNTNRLPPAAPMMPNKSVNAAISFTVPAPPSPFTLHAVRSERNGRDDSIDQREVEGVCQERWVAKPRRKRINRSEAMEPSVPLLALGCIVASQFNRITEGTFRPLPVKSASAVVNCSSQS